MKQKKSASILRKFLLFNLLVFSVLGLFTIIYLKAIQPQLVKQRTINHSIIIKNTSDHLDRLNIIFDKKNINTFLLSTRFLFQSLDRVQFYNNKGYIVGDTNILDLDQTVFSRTDSIIERKIGETSSKVENKKNELFEKKSDNSIFIDEKILKRYEDKPMVFEKKINDNFFVSTLDQVKINDEVVGYIMVTEQANDILIAVEERKNFIIRTVLAVALVILIFSLFLNKYILKPIKFLVLFTESIKAKADKPTNIGKFFVRGDEIGKLTKSIDEMTAELQKRTNRAETFSADLAHEIRNPLASLKGASELLDKTNEKIEREKLFEIINHDVERIERLITDYSQMLKDEASLSRAKMEKIDLSNVVNSVVEDFNSDLLNSNKNIKININNSGLNGSKLNVLGVESKLEQIVANLLDNAVSFSPSNSKISVVCDIKEKDAQLIILDEGPGFNEKNIDKVFNRFYSNRPENFGEHSGLGLNIVKNIIELHGGSITASNQIGNKKGARIEVLLPIID